MRTNTTRSLARSAALACLLFANGISAFAQEASRVQVGGEFSLLGLDKASWEGTGVPGAGVRVDVGLTRRVDVEGRATWFPVRAGQLFEAQGGRTLQLAAGVRGRFFTLRRVSVFGVLLPGLLHFTDAVTGVDGPATVTGGATHFALDWGIGTEVYSTRRWTARAEVTGPLYFVRGTELSRSEPSPAGGVLVFGVPPQTLNPWQISMGVSYRLGRVLKNSVEEPVAGRWEAGGQFTRATFNGVLATDLHNSPAVGGFASYRLAPSIYADAAFNAFTSQSRERSPFEGGYLTQALGGVKVGIRKDRYGLFFKSRFGVSSHSGAVGGRDASGVIIRRSNALAVDLGGVFERYVNRRFLVRFDGGDVVSVFRSFMDNGERISLSGSRQTDSLQMTCGFGWRF